MALVDTFKQPLPRPPPHPSPAQPSPAQPSPPTTHHPPPHPLNAHQPAPPPPPPLCWPRFPAIPSLLARLNQAREAPPLSQHTTAAVPHHTTPPPQPASQPAPLPPTSPPLASPNAMVQPAQGPARAPTHCNECAERGARGWGCRARRGQGSKGGPAPSAAARPGPSWRLIGACLAVFGPRFFRAQAGTTACLPLHSTWEGDCSWGRPFQPSKTATPSPQTPRLQRTPIYCGYPSMVGFETPHKKPALYCMHG